jgi:hypothetical protein
LPNAVELVETLKKQFDQQNTLNRPFVITSYDSALDSYSIQYYATGVSVSVSSDTLKKSTYWNDAFKRFNTVQDRSGRVQSRSGRDQSGRVQSRSGRDQSLASTISKEELEQQIENKNWPTLISSQVIDALPHPNKTMVCQCA